jgi:hypothetical protein
MLLEKNTIAFDSDDNIIHWKNQTIVNKTCKRVYFDNNVIINVPDTSHVLLEDDTLIQLNDIEISNCIQYIKAKSIEYGYTSEEEKCMLIGLSLNSNIINHVMSFDDRNIYEQFKELFNKIYSSIVISTKDDDLSIDLTNNEVKTIIFENFKYITEIAKSASLNDRFSFAKGALGIGINKYPKAKVSRNSYIPIDIIVSILYSVGINVGIFNDEKCYIVPLVLDKMNNVCCKVEKIETYECECFEIPQKEYIVNGIKIMT